jgi:hypothetical protein
MFAPMNLLSNDVHLSYPDISWLSYLWMNGLFGMIQCSMNIHGGLGDEDSPTDRMAPLSSQRYASSLTWIVPELLDPIEMKRNNRTRIVISGVHREN